MQALEKKLKEKAQPFFQVYKNENDDFPDFCLVILDAVIFVECKNRQYFSFKSYKKTQKAQCKLHFTLPSAYLIWSKESGLFKYCKLYLKGKLVFCGDIRSVVKFLYERAKEIKKSNREAL